MDTTNFYITKSNGEEEFFSLDKYINSLHRIGFNREEIDSLLNKVLHQVYNKISTQRLYGITFNEIKNLSLRYASIYSLKEGLRALGPSGFPFEHIISQLFLQQNYIIMHNQYIKGSCASHEIDVIATLPSSVEEPSLSNKGKTTLIEVKFHKELGLKSDIKIPLYVKARFDDIKSAGNYDIASYFIITNTKFTLNAISYSKCAQLNLIAWGYPKDGSIETLIIRYKLYPITVLHCLSDKEAQHLIKNGVILYQDLEIAKEKKLVSELKLKEIYNEYQNLRS